MSRFLTCTFFLLFFAPTGGAQTPDALVEGQRIRVVHRCKVAHDQVTDCRKSRSPRVDIGHLQSIGGDTLRILAQSPDAELAIPRASIAELWVVEGKGGNFLAGAGLGLLAGALIGGVIGSTQEFCLLSCEPATGFGAIIGAPAGLLLGGVVGASIKSDRWREVRVSDHRMSVQPRRGGIDLRVSIAF